MTSQFTERLQLVKFVIVHEILNKKLWNINRTWLTASNGLQGAKFPVSGVRKNHYGVTDFHFQPRSVSCGRKVNAASEASWKSGDLFAIQLNTVIGWCRTA